MMIIRGPKLFRIECDNTCRSIDSGGAASRFLEVLKAFCVVFLDVSIMNV